MLNKITFALLLATGLLSNAFAADAPESRTHSSERPIETSTLGLPLPRVAPGSMTLRPCEIGCALVTVEITSASQFFVGRQAVSFADLRALTQRRSANATVFYDLNTNVVTRIVVSN